MRPPHQRKSSDMPHWAKDALLVAQVAERLALSMDEAGWLRERMNSGKGPWHWRVIVLYLKSNWRQWQRDAGGWR